MKAGARPDLPNPPPEPPANRSRACFWFQKLEVTKQQLKQLSKYKQDYEAVRERLETLPDEVSHEVMVPLGKLAYVPGRLKHTNEIMVLLGENWFVERSAKQSVEIVRRRIASKTPGALPSLRRSWFCDSSFCFLLQNAKKPWTASIRR